MTWRWELSPRAERDLRQIDRDSRRRILTALERLIEDPPRGDVRKLAGRSDEWRLRVGPWRAIFR